MTMTAVIFFILGAVVLWGGLITTLMIFLYNENKEKLNGVKNK